MPRPYPQEFRENGIRVARNRELDTRRADIAKDFGISESCLHGRLKFADVEDGIKPGMTAADNAELRAATKRIPVTVTCRVLKIARQPVGAGNAFGCLVNVLVVGVGACGGGAGASKLTRSRWVGRCGGWFRLRGGTR